MRGSIILIEGLDRTGKSTQVDLIVKNFIKNGQKAELVKFPDRTTPIGELINSFLTKKDFNLPKESIHLLFSANRWELKNKLIERVESGTHLIMDRYLYSGIAYSAANGLDREWCKYPDIGLPMPDLILFLTFKDSTNVAKLSNRENYGDEKYEKVDLQQRVKVQFEALFESADNVVNVYIDNKSIDQVAIEISQITEKLMGGLEGEVKSFK